MSGWIIPLLLAACAAAQQQSSIAGRVVDAATGQPLDRVHVRLIVGALNETPTAVYGAMSDSKGHFSISPIPVGSYLVRPELSGYFYLPKSFMVVIKAGEPLDDFRIELTPRAILSGRVLDEHGDPVKGVQVFANSRDTVANLAMKPEQRDSIRTGDLGEFRVIIPPGKYHLEAIGYTGSEIRSDGTLAPVYYTNTSYPSDPSSARPDAGESVEALPGKETAGLDILLIRLQLGSITGTVAGAAPGADLSVHIRSDSGARDLTVPVGTDGTFSATQLPHGNYHIYAESGDGDTRMRSVQVELELKAGAANVSLAIMPPVNVTGKLTGGPHAIVHLEARGWERNGQLTARVADDGTFQFSKLQPEKYTLRVSSAPEDAYIRSVELNGESIAERVQDGTNRDDQSTPAFCVPLDLGNISGGAGLKIVLAQGARVSGGVQEKSGLPADGLVDVELMPDGKHSGGLDKWIRGGAYVFHAIPPGKYRIFARPQMELISAADFRKMVDEAELIELHEGDRVQKDVKVLEGAGDAKKNP